MQASTASFAQTMTGLFLGQRSKVTSGLLLLALALACLGSWRPALAAEDDFLEPEKAFQFSARPFDAKTVEVTFDIAPGYYLYRDLFRFSASGASLG
jgi:thioredoxin:protein disulfide reductase